MNPFAAELIGTALLILLGNGVVANVVLDKTKGNNGGYNMITLGWGLGVYVGVLVAGPYSGAHLNPAVSIGLAVSGKFPWGEVPVYIIAQCIGAALGTTLNWVVHYQHYLATDDTLSKLGSFATAPAIDDPITNFASEIIGTFVLIFAVLYIAGPSFAGNGLEDVIIGLGSLGALPVALVVVVIGMSLGGTTGYAINPARDLMPRIMHTILPMGKKGSSYWKYAWIPIIAPITGAVIAALSYIWLTIG